MKFNQTMLVIVVIRQWAGYLSSVSGFGSWQGHRFFPVPQYPHPGGLLSLSSVGTYKLLSITPGKEDAKVNVHTFEIRPAEPCVWCRQLQQIFVCMWAK